MTIPKRSSRWSWATCSTCTPFGHGTCQIWWRDYIDECRERGFERVRIIHGKGIGNLRRTVHAILERHDGVQEYALMDETGGGWGATSVRLRPL